MTPTPILVVDPAAPDPRSIAAAAAVLRGGGLVAFPTETVYGLGANALDAAAVARIFAAKDRPADDPIIVHVAERRGLDAVAAAVPAVAARLAAAFWPGPLTLVVPRGAAIPRIVTAGGDTVGVRMPAHPVALALIAAAGVPVAAPSANPFGRTSPTTAAHVAADLGDRIDLIVDGGPCPVGIESTVVDCTVDPPVVLRPGGIALEDLRAVVPGIAMEDPGDGRVRATTGAPSGGDGPTHASSLRAPGMLDRHYAPRARLVLVRAHGPVDAAADAVVARAASELAARGLAVGVLGLTLEDPPVGLVARGWWPPHGVARRQDVADDGSSSSASVDAVPDASVAARGLYAALRALDAAGCVVILARDLGAAGLGLALRDRLTRAAQGRVVDTAAAPTARAATDGTPSRDPAAGAADQSAQDAVVAAVVRLADPPGMPRRHT